MLDKIPLFSELSADELEALERRANLRSYPKNTVLITEGDQSDSLYIIKTGKVKIYLNDAQGKEVILNIQGPKDYFGELALLDEEPRSASVMTLEPAQFCVISKSDFEQVLNEQPRIAISMLRGLTKQVRRLTDSVRDLALLDVYERVTHTLLKLAKEENGKQVITQKLTHQEIANMVGASREMVSRIMKELTRGEYLTVSNKMITIEKKLPAAW